MSTPEREAPPVSEEIHMPEPTFLPFWTAVGITLAIVGLTVFFPVLSIVGVVVTVGCVVQWIRHTRRDISELPPEHH
jgi:hypothetical protein